MTPECGVMGLCHLRSGHEGRHETSVDRALAAAPEQIAEPLSARQAALERVATAAYNVVVLPPHIDAYSTEDRRRIYTDVLNEALHALAAIPAKPDVGERLREADVRTVVAGSSPYRNCQRAGGFRAPCPEVDPGRPGDWCSFCQAHSRLSKEPSE